MPYDYTAAINAAQAVVDRQENKEGGSGYTYPLLYPPKNNTIVVRPLFNPASGQIVRLINRHEKVPCYRTYNIECPICKVMQEVKDMTGQDPFGRAKASKSRGLAFAQFISSTSPVDKGGNRGTFTPGEIVLFMFPWTVYTQINTTIQAIAQTPTGMDQAFSHADSGLYIQISVDNSFKYTTTQVPYMTFPSGKTDEEFSKMLDEMESLNEQVVPSSITEEVDKQVKEYSDAIYRQYVVPRTPTQGVPQGTAPVNYGSSAQAVPQQSYSTAAVSSPTNQGVSQNSSPQTPPAPAVGSRPACFGKHVQGSPQCITCPVEVMCMDPTSNSSTPW